jgi:hypothetical protein
MLRSLTRTSDCYGLLTGSFPDEAQIRYVGNSQSSRATIEHGPYLIVEEERAAPGHRSIENRRFWICQVGPRKEPARSVIGPIRSFRLLGLIPPGLRLTAAGRPAAKRTTRQVISAVSAPSAGPCSFRSTPTCELRPMRGALSKTRLILRSRSKHSRLSGRGWRDGWPSERSLTEPRLFSLWPGLIP